MKRAINIVKDVEQVGTIEDLTSIFQSIASLRISQTKNKVTSSTKFFNELWAIYTQLRSDPSKRIDKASHTDRNKRNAIIMITSGSGLSGDIDQRILSKVLLELDPKTTGLLVVGSHGANQLKQRQITYDKYFPLPDSDENFDVSPIMNELANYGHTTVFYETYVSLGVQEVSKIDLVSAVQALSEVETQNQGETIDSRHYLFEPSLEEVVKLMETTMLGIAISQAILESKLAQYASRFNAMSAANDKAKELTGEYRLAYHRARRAESDGRLKEIIVTLNNLSQA